MTIWSLFSDELVVRCRTFANVRVHPDELPLKAFVGESVNRAEKSRRARRRKRGLRVGRRRSRGCHPSRSVDTPAPNSKPPNMRKANHRRRGERWLIVASERLRADAKMFVQSKSDLSWQRDKRRSIKLHCVAKWTRLQAHAKELGFPPKLSFDTSFFKWLDKEFPRPGKSYVDEHALLFTKQPFTYFDPPGDWRHEEPFDPVMAMLQSGNSAGKRPSGEVRPETTNKAAFCRRCGGRGHRADSGLCPSRSLSSVKKGDRPLRRR
jgi:hypothetical protein